MNATTYQALAMRTANRTANDTDERRLVNAALGLAGEAGEIADSLKKWHFQSHDLDRTKLIEEAGDLLWYVALLCEALHVDMGTVMGANLAKLRRRFPEGFSAERSRNREGARE